MSDRKIEGKEPMSQQMKERIKRTAYNMICKQDNRLLIDSFPEAFEPEKHWAIILMQEVLYEIYNHGLNTDGQKLEKALSAFNDDGSLKK